jgi:hypothetical protein
MAKRKIEPNTVIRNLVWHLYFLLGFGYFITLNFADLNGRTSFGFTLGWFINHIWRNCVLITNRMSYV